MTEDLRIVGPCPESEPAKSSMPRGDTARYAVALADTAERAAILNIQSGWSRRRLMESRRVFPRRAGGL